MAAHLAPSMSGMLGTARTTGWRAAVACTIIAAGSPGCATIWAGIQLSGSKTYSTDGMDESVTPVGGREQKLNVEVLSLAPLALGCTMSERAERERVHEEWHRWGFGWKMVSGFFFVGESTGAAILLASPTGPSGPRHLAMGGFLAVDALATGVLFFALHPETYVHEWERPGPWTATSTTCPEELVPPPTATVEQTCQWLRARGDPAARAICPAPAVVVAPPYPPAPMVAPPVPLGPPVLLPAPLHLGIEIVVPAPPRAR